MTDAPAGTTLLLDQSAWDLVVDAAGDIAIADAPYALAQDVASAGRTYLGEVWFDTTVGVPYDKIINQRPTQQAIKAALSAAALTVPGVVRAKVVINQFVNTQQQSAIGQAIYDSSGNLVTDSSGGTITDSPPSISLQALGLRNVVGQILFVDVNNNSASVTL